MAKEVRVHVTHFESPTKFFFCFEDSEKRKSENKSSLRRIESEVALVAKNALPKGCSRVLGSINGYLHYRRLQWERVKIVRIDSNGSMKVFLCDRGYFMDIYGGQEVQLIDLPESLQRPSEIILEGSLALQPCDKVQDRETLEIINQPVRHWNQQAISFVQKFNQKKGNTELKWSFVLMKTERGIYFGDLLLKTPLQTMSISEELINKNLAVPLDKIKLEPKLQAFQPSANIRKIILSCCPDLISAKPLPTGTAAQTKSKPMLPDGVEVGKYSNDRPNEKAEHIPRKEIKSRKLRPSPQQTTAKPPLNIFVFGQQVWPAFKSLDDAAFTKSLHDHLATNRCQMTKLHSHAWPQIKHGRSTIIIPASTSRSISLMTFMPPFINNLIENVSTEAGGVGPTSVVIAKNSNEINDIRRMCTSLAPLLKIEVFGMESKAIQLINGCDLLLSTPLAFARVVEGTTMNLFQKDRIKTLVFHEIDQMMGKYDSEVNEIVRRCSYGFKNKEKNPQMIVTSSMWSKSIAKFKALICPSKLVLCVESFIEVAALCGVKITMDLSSKNEEKFESVRKYLEKNAFRTKRSVIVVNDEADSKFLVQKFNESSIRACPAHINSAEIDKRNWLLEEMGQYSVLIATDATLEAMQLNQIQNLVHFSIPKSWSIFVQRFSLLMLSFYKSLERENDSNSAATIIFVDEENNTKEFLHLVKYMESRDMNVPPTVTESLKSLFDRDEQKKIDDQIPVCNNIWNSGECTDYPCLHRHMFAIQDSPSVDFRSIKFQVVNVLSPAHYTIRVLSQKIGTNWSSLEETSSRTEALLSNELQEFCNDPGNLKKTGITTNGNYVALIEKTWKRCKSTMNAEPNQPLCKIYLVDEGKEVHWKLASIYALPAPFADQPPLVYKLRVLNLQPLNGENKWSPDAVKKTEQMLENYKGKLTADIEFAVQNTLFCKSIEAQGSGSSTVKINFQEKLSQFCVKDEKTGNRLMTLLKKAGLIPENDPNNQLIEEIGKLEQSKEMKSNQIEDTKNSAQETWKKLSHNSFYDVEVGRFNNPDSFFVVLASKQNRLQNIVNNDVLKNIQEGAMCLVKRESIQRGKILKVDDASVQVFLVDLGEIVGCQPSELYSAPPETFSNVCYQSVHCRLIGVKPKYNMSTWPPKQSEVIEKLIRQKKAPLRLFVVGKNEKTKECCILGQRSYEVVLIDPGTEKQLDDEIVERRFADRDQYEKPKDLEECFNSESDSEENEDEKSEDMLKKLAESYARMLNDMSETESEDERTESAMETIESRPEYTGSKPRTSDVLPEPSSTLSGLSPLVKHPLIVWQQNEVKIHLSISATDCIDYGMKIDDTTVEVAILYAENRSEKAIVDLYCGIVPEMCSHEKRGLNIVADLTKKESNVEWPRLTEGKEHSKFIIFSNENIKNISNQPLQGIPAELVCQKEQTHLKTDQLELSEDDDEDFY